jgi:site-specific DNA-methyltransferase (adenine-specific)
MKSEVHNIDFLQNGLPDKCANLIIADPPYFEVKGSFDFVWKSFDEYLQDVERWAVECKRLLADNGTLFWYGDAKNIAYSQTIFDKYFNLLNSLVWENTNDHKQQIRFNPDLRTFAPLTERLLMYEQRGQKTGGELIFEQFLKPKNPFSNYLRIEFKNAGFANREIAQLFPSKTGGLTGCVSNWLNGDNVITEEQYNTIRDYCNNRYLKKPYEELKAEYEELKAEYEELKAEYEELRRPFNNERFYGDVIRIPNYETGKYSHDTVKPEKLTTALILTCSRQNDLVVVPFAGSGTECAMAVKYGRIAQGFEIEKKWADMSRERMNKTQLITGTTDPTKAIQGQQINLF